MSDLPPCSRENIVASIDAYGAFLYIRIRSREKSFGGDFSKILDRRNVGVLVSGLCVLSHRNGLPFCLSLGRH